MNAIFKELSYSQLRGRVFTSKNCGDFTVYEYHNADKVDIIFLGTGTVVRTSKKVILRDKPSVRDPLARSVFGVGCIGIGRHKAHIKGADTKPYGVWRAMLRRCYYRGDGVVRHCYDGVTVCEEWMNFQNFADWFESSYPTDGGRYELDKDTRQIGSMLYSPDTCTFMMKRDNLAARRF